MADNIPDSYYNETPSAGVQERDIDLLVVEELASSIDFVHWFCSKVLPEQTVVFPVDVSQVEVKHSCLHLGDGHGESDIVLRFTDQAGGSHIYLIENKIDAAFTQEQAGRYRRRLQNIKLADDLDHGKTVLLAPLSFLESRLMAQDFDATISYEEILEFFNLQAESTSILELAYRYAYRQKFIQSAIDKKKYSGPVLNPDPRVSDFRAEYVKIVNAIAPDLKLGTLSKVKEPNAWIRYDNALPNTQQPRRFSLVHRPFERVEIEIDPDPARRDIALNRITKLISNEVDMDIAGRGKRYLYIFINTFKLEMREPISGQIESIQQAIRKLQRLRDWYNQNYDELKAALEL